MTDIKSSEQMREHMEEYFTRAKTKISEKIIDEFVKSLKFNDGHIAHMHYGPLLDSISEPELIDFLSSVGISSQIFTGIRDSSCEGDMAARSCIRNPGYTCDPRYCQSH